MREEGRGGEEGEGRETCCYQISVVGIQCGNLTVFGLDVVCEVLFCYQVLIAHILPALIGLQWCLCMLDCRLFVS